MPIEFGVMLMVISGPLAVTLLYIKLDERKTRKQQQSKDFLRKLES